MQTASFSGFVEMIIEIMIFYYVVKFLMRLFMPIIVKKVVDKAGENFQSYQNKQTSNQSNQNTANTKSKESKKVGEYVDFEEIE